MNTLKPKPISTAPKNGIWILGIADQFKPCNDGDKLVLLHWDKRDHQWEDAYGNQRYYEFWDHIPKYNTPSEPKTFKEKILKAYRDLDERSLLIEDIDLLKEEYDKIIALMAEHEGERL